MHLGVASTRLPVSCTYGLGVVRRTYDALCRKELIDLVIVCHRAPGKKTFPGSDCGVGNTTYFVRITGDFKQLLRLILRILRKMSQIIKKIRTNL